MIYFHLERRSILRHKKKFTYIFSGRIAWINKSSVMMPRIFDTAVRSVKPDANR